MVVSFSCQICGVDTAMARMRTPEEPLSAAWSYQGANYIGSFSEVPVTMVPFTTVTEGPGDQECQDCTIADRTPQFSESLVCWPDEDKDDAEWQPSADGDGSARGSAGSSEEDSDFGDEESMESSEDHDDDAPTQYPLCELWVKSWPARLHRGIWHNGRIYYSGSQRQPQTYHMANQVKIPPEHVASTSCQSFQGINGHVLSVSQMKNCRNVRFLMPKLADWDADTSDHLFERDSLFFLSGETYGSALAVATYHQYYCSLYPARHGVDELMTAWEYVNEGCKESNHVRPLPVHSYCLDMYAKSSMLRLGKVDLDGLWHWREAKSDPKSYSAGDRFSLQRPELERARSRWSKSWRHVPGDEWLAANPVEVPGIVRALKSCRAETALGNARTTRRGILAFPSEVIYYVLLHLDPEDLDAVSRACRMLYEQAQQAYKVLVSRDMPWLWELSSNNTYPASPDRPPPWDPIYPSGLPPFTLPVGLETEEAEEQIWATIIAESPEMEDIARAVKAVNQRRREELLKAYNEQEAGLLREWQTFRAAVEQWISRSHKEKHATAMEPINWRRLWLICSPTTTPIPGLRNRARIWEDCNNILDFVGFATDLGVIDKIWKP